MRLHSVKSEISVTRKLLTIIYKFLRYKKKKSPLFSCSDVPKYHHLLVLFSVYFQRIHHLYFFQGTSLHNSEVKEDMELNFKSETYYGEIREEM